MVYILDCHDQFEVKNMKHYECIDYNQFFKSFYKV